MCTWHLRQLRRIIQSLAVLHRLQIGQVEELHLVLLHRVRVALHHERARLPHVRPHVEVQVTALLEPPPTNGAFKRLNVRVSAHMLPQVH